MPSAAEVFGASLLSLVFVVFLVPSKIVQFVPPYVIFLSNTNAGLNPVVIVGYVDVLEV